MEFAHRNMTTDWSSYLNAFEMLLTMHNVNVLAGLVVQSSTRTTQGNILNLA